MTAAVTRSAARPGGAGLELARMMAGFVWVAGATVVTVVALGALPGWLTGDRGLVRRVATVQEAEQRLGARVLIPGYFPAHLEWPPHAIHVSGGRRGSVRIDLRSTDGTGELHILESTREGEPVAPPLLEGRTVLRTSRTSVGKLPATLSDVLVDGKLHRELAWELRGRAMILRSSGDVEELFRMARTSHREGGR